MSPIHFADEGNYTTVIVEDIGDSQVMYVGASILALGELAQYKAVRALVASDDETVLVVILSFAARGDHIVDCHKIRKYKNDLTPHA